MLRKKQINESSKQTLTLTTTKFIIAQNNTNTKKKTKLMITEQKTNADNT